MLAIVSILLASMALWGTTATTAKLLNWSVASAVLAVALIFVAQYGAWRIEREHYEKELAKNALPEINGEIRVALAKPYTSTIDDGLNHLRSHIVTLFLYVCNRHPVDTNIAEVKLNGVELHPPRFLFDISLSSPGRGTVAPNEIILRRGIQTELIVMASAKISDITPPIDLTALKVSLVDGFGGTHLIQAKKGLELVIVN
jgi:hypothetical protein